MINSVDAELQKYYKKLYQNVIGPVVGIAVLALCFIKYSPSPDYFAALSAIIPLFIFSQLVVIRNWQIPTPFGTVETRSDMFDMIRWMVTFVIDVFIVTKLKLSAGEVTLMWIILTFGCLVEIHGFNKRVIALVFSVFCFNVGLFLSQNFNAAEAIFYEITFGGATIFYITSEFWLTHTLHDFFKTKVTLQLIEQEAENVKKNAFIGSQLQIYLHEVNNALMLISFTETSIRKTEPATAERLDRAIAKLNDVKDLVLENIGIDSIEAKERVFSVNEFVTELQDLTLPSFQKHYPNLLNLNKTLSPKEAGDFCIRERSGASYYVIANLVKNSIEALIEKKISDPMIQLDLSMESGYLKLEISDNGPGFPAKVLDMLQKGESITTRSAGHGLGMKFVINECQKSDIKFDLTSERGLGTTFTLRWELIEGKPRKDAVAI